MTEEYSLLKDECGKLAEDVRTSGSAVLFNVYDLQLRSWLMAKHFKFRAPVDFGHSGLVLQTLISNTLIDCIPGNPESCMLQLIELIQVEIMDDLNRPWPASRGGEVARPITQEGRAWWCFNQSNMVPLGELAASGT